MTSFNPLPVHSLTGDVGLFRNVDTLHAQVKLDSPAVLVMTDLRRAHAVTIDPDKPIDVALHKMKAAGVRLLFVTSDENSIVGVVTSTDIQGDLPVRLQRERTLRREDIVVRDIMTVTSRLELLSISDVLEAKVGDIIETLHKAGRRHALVFDQETESPRNAIRGIFSATQISQQLGLLIDAPPVARTFAEVELALNRSA